MEQVKLSFVPPAALVTLNRPQVRNALSPELIGELRGCLKGLSTQSDISAVILTGAGKAFCAGADISSLREMTDRSAEEARLDSKQIMDLLREIYEFPKPVIAAVNGPAMGGGCGLATVCDIVVAAEDAVFGYTECRIGFIPALVTFFLLRTCGEKKASELLLTARPFSALEAKELGLVNSVVAADRVLDEAHGLVGRIAENSPSAVGLHQRVGQRVAGVECGPSTYRRFAVECADADQ